MLYRSIEFEDILVIKNRGDEVLDKVDKLERYCCSVHKINSNQLVIR